MPMPCTPTPSRAAFIMPNMPAMPAEDERFSPGLGGAGLGPSRQAMASSKLSTQVAWPLMPILCSMPPVLTPLRAPILPSSLDQEFRHHEEIHGGEIVVDLAVLVGNLGDHHMDDVVGQVLVAAGDENLGAVHA